MSNVSNGVAFFFDKFDTDLSGTINVTEFNDYLGFLRGSDEDHCVTADDLYDDFGITEATDLDVPLLLARATECVLSVYCGVDFEIELGGEIYECGEHDHDEDHDDDHDHDDDDHDHDRRSSARKLQHDHDDHDHEEGEEEEVHLIIGDTLLECFHDEEEEQFSHNGKYSGAVWAKVMGSTIGVSLISLLGAFLIFFGFDHDSEGGRMVLHALLAFAMGTLIWVCFGHLAPEAVENLEDNEDFGLYVVAGILLGAATEFAWPFIYTVFFRPSANADSAKNALEPVEVKDGDEVELKSENPMFDGHLHGHTLETKGATILNIIIGDFFHNFVDGVLIALAFGVCGEAGGDNALGATVTVGIILHEIPQELSDFVILIQCGLSFWKALFFNFLSALSAIIAAIAILSAGEVSENTQGTLLALSTGILAFITLAEVFPLVKEGATTNWAVARTVAFFLMGIGLGLLLELVPHEHCEAETGEVHNH